MKQAVGDLGAPDGLGGQALGLIDVTELGEAGGEAGPREDRLHGFAAEAGEPTVERGHVLAEQRRPTSR